MRGFIVSLVITFGLIALPTGCISISGPEKIEVGGTGGEPADGRNDWPDASEVTCQRELERARRKIRELEREIATLRQKLAAHEQAAK